MGSIRTLSEFEDFLNLLNYKEFENFIYDILSDSKKFDGVTSNVNVNGYQIDIVATEKDKSTKKQKTWIVEIKRTRIIHVDVIQHLIKKWDAVKESYPSIKFVLISTGQLTSIAFDLASNNNIEVWSLKEILNYTSKILLKKYSGKSVIDKKQKDTTIKDKSDTLISSLQELVPGLPDYFKFQQLASDILEYLFCPPLESPKFEESDLSGKNRRDMIFENSALDGFWRIAREVYNAHQIVVDAKNYSKSLTKKPILEIAHYLKPYGCGMFGIIVSRSDASSAGLHAVKEEWISNKKMIVIMTDKDIIEMLNIKKKDGGKPEEIIRRKVANFRISL